MSKTIMPSKTLSDFDRQYLSDRGLNPDDYILADEEEAPDEDGETEDDGDGEDVPYTDWTKDELEIELQSRGLKKSGDKAELIARLEEHDATIADGDS